MKHFLFLISYLNSNNKKEVNFNEDESEVEDEY
jgi:hypothetical protein